MPAKMEHSFAASVGIATGAEENAEKENTYANQAGIKKTSLKQRLWPISISQLEAHGIPETHLLKLSITIWFSSVIINILGVGLPILILQVYDRIIPNQSFSTLALMVLGFVCFLALEFFLKLGRAYVLGWSATKFEMAVSQAAIGRMLNAPLADVTHDRVQTHLDRLSSVSRLADFFGGPNSLLVIDLPFVMIFVVVMLLIGGPLVLVPVVVLTIFAVLTAIYGQKLKGHFEEREVQDNRTYDFIAECLRGVTTLKGMAMEPFMLRRFERLQKSRAITNFQTIAASTNAQSLSSNLGNITIVAIVTSGGILAVKGDFSIGTLAACTLLAGRIVQPVVRFAGLWTEFQKLELALKEASQLFKLEESTTEPQIDNKEGASRIELKHASFRDPAGGKYGPYNLKIESRECIGLVGDDAQIKQSFLQTISGFIEPVSGQIEYNGIEVGSYRLGNRGSVIYVGPKSTVLDGTILENLTLFDTGPSIEEVRWASRMTGVDHEINKLPQGYDSPVGDSASEKLPLGTLRRIVLTRAIAMMPKVLILDEPQMFLDAESDKKLVKCLSLLKQHTTIVLSTMRPSYFFLADRMLKFENGQISPVNPAQNKSPQRQQNGRGSNHG